MTTTTALRVAPTSLPEPVVDTQSFPDGFRFDDAMNGWGVASGCQSAELVPIEPCAFETVVSRDGGRTWSARGAERRFSYTKKSRYDEVGLRFVPADAVTGWLIGGAPMVTHDRGLTWTAEPLPSSVTDLIPVSGGAWALAGGCAEETCTPRLYRQTKGTWTLSPAQPPGDNPFSLLAAATSATAYLLSETTDTPTPTQTLVRSVDGGRSWGALTAHCGPHWARLVPTAGGPLWMWCGNQPATGQGGTLYRSADGGRSWTVVADNAAADFSGGPPAKGNMPNSGYMGDLVPTADGALFMSRSKFGYVARSLDGGTTWTVLLGDDGGGGYSLDALNQRVIWAYSNGCVWHTTTGNAPWSLINSSHDAVCATYPTQGAQ